MGSLTFSTGARVFLDSCVLIYWVEDVTPLSNVLRPVFDAAQKGQATLIVSALSVLETTVEPIRRGDRVRVRRFREILRSSAGIECIPISDDILDLAAELRAKSGIRTPDAILAATSLTARCDVFLTNDSRLAKVPGLNVAMVSDLIELPKGPL